MSCMIESSFVWDFLYTNIINKNTWSQRSRGKKPRPLALISLLKILTLRHSLLVFPWSFLMASTAREGSGQLINFLSSLIFPTLQALGSWAGIRSPADCCSDNCLVYHTDWPKGLQAGRAWQWQDSCSCVSLLLNRHRPKCNFSPNELLIKQ